MHSGIDLNEQNNTAMANAAIKSLADRDFKLAQLEALEQEQSMNVLFDPDELTIIDLGPTGDTVVKQTPYVVSKSFQLIVSSMEKNAIYFIHDYRELMHGKTLDLPVWYSSLNENLPRQMVKSKWRKYCQEVLSDVANHNFVIVAKDLTNITPIFCTKNMIYLKLNFEILTVLWKLNHRHLIEEDLAKAWVSYRQAFKSFIANLKAGDILTLNFYTLQVTNEQGQTENMKFMLEEQLAELIFNMRQVCFGLNNHPDIPTTTLAISRTILCEMQFTAAYNYTPTPSLKQSNVHLALPQYPTIEEIICSPTISALTPSTTAAFASPLSNITSSVLAISPPNVDIRAPSMEASKVQVPGALEESFTLSAEACDPIIKTPVADDFKVQSLPTMFASGVRSPAFFCIQEEPPVAAPKSFWRKCFGC